MTSEGHAVPGQGSAATVSSSAAGAFGRANELPAAPLQRSEGLWEKCRREACMQQSVMLLGEGRAGVPLRLCFLSLQSGVASVTFDACAGFGLWLNCL